MLEFYLNDVNPHSPSFSTVPYGLYYQNVTDVILVGMYLSDTEVSQQNAQRQQELGDALVEMGYSVKNVMLNYYAPYSCAMMGYCVNPWTSAWWMGYDYCIGYVAGCPPNDPRLSFDQWQKPLIVGKATSPDGYLRMPLFQDTDWNMAWDLFGGLEGDLFIYDNGGRLHTYMCNLDNGLTNPEAWADCPDGLVGGGLRDDTSFEAALDKAIEAASVGDANERCREYSMANDFNDELANWANRVTNYYVDDFYYYADFGWNADRTKGNVISIERRHSRIRFVHKVPTYVWASFFALLACGGTGLVLYRRWKALRALDAERGTVRFTQLATEDSDDVVLEATLVDGTEPTGAAGARATNDESYGAI